MPPYPTPIGTISRPGLLWCEGPHDYAILRRLVVSENLTDWIRIEVLEGKPNLPTYLASLLLRPRFHDLRALGIVLDADEDARATMDSVTGHLEANGLVRTSAHASIERGDCSDGVTRTVGAFVTPDGVAPGAFESLLMRTVAPGPLLACVQDFVACVAPEVQHTRIAQWAKLEFHAWLAASQEPGILPGQALDAHIIDQGHAAFDDLKSFLRALAAAATAPDQLPAAPDQPPA